MSTVRMLRRIAWWVFVVCLLAGLAVFPAYLTSLPVNEYALQQVHPGMTSQQVKDLIGEPTTISPIDDLEKWEYSRWAKERQVRVYFRDGRVVEVKVSD